MSRRKPKWTSEDTRGLGLAAAFFIGGGAVWGLLSGEGIFNGTMGGAFIFGLLGIITLALLATGNFRD
jgi:hypothetical protein